VSTTIEKLSTETLILNEIIDLSFETSLNTFLGVNKIQSSQLDVETYKVIASSVELITKKLKNEIQLLLSLVKEKSDASLLGQSDFEKIKFITNIYTHLENLEKHNHKIWLASSQFKVQNSQQDVGDSIRSISQDIENLNQKLEFEIKKIRRTAIELEKELINHFDYKKVS